MTPVPKKFITASKIQPSIKKPFKKAIIPSLPRSNTTLKKTLKKCPPLRLSKLLRVHMYYEKTMQYDSQ